MSYWGLFDGTRARRRLVLDLVCRGIIRGLLSLLGIVVSIPILVRVVGVVRRRILGLGFQTLESAFLWWNKTWLEATNLVALCRVFRDSIDVEEIIQEVVFHPVLLVFAVAAPVELGAFDFRFARGHFVEKGE
jgi:hypothetical protein